MMALKKGQRASIELILKDAQKHHRSLEKFTTRDRVIGQLRTAHDDRALLIIAVKACLRKPKAKKGKK